MQYPLRFLNIISLQHSVLIAIDVRQIFVLYYILLSIIISKQF